MAKDHYDVWAKWDPEAGVWVVTSDDVPGLVTEAETVEGVLENLAVLVPELLEANGMLPESGTPDVPIHLMSERLERIPLAS